MTIGSGFQSFLLQEYNIVNILDVASVFKVIFVWISKAVQPTWKINMPRRSGLHSFVVERYGMVNILEIPSMSKAS